MPLDAVGTLPAYASHIYARSLAHVGRPFFVPAWNTHILLRPIPGDPARFDAAGPYPLCCLAADAELAVGLACLGDVGAVSVVLVADPFAGPALPALQQAFQICRPFKTHWVVDRAAPWAPSKHHRDRIRRGNAHAGARRVDLRDPVWRAHWTRLYGELVARRRITGVQAFPQTSFEALAELDDDQVVVIAAEGADAVLAMQIWIRQGERAYSHLTATSEAGYRLGSTYVMYDAAIQQLARATLLDLGGGIGRHDDPADSLAHFKRGFANHSAPVHLCGSVLDPAIYAVLAAGRDEAFFPAYRSV